MLNFISKILNYIFPLHCLSCKKEGDLFCFECQQKHIKYNEKQVCPVTYKISKWGKCLKNDQLYLDGLIVMSPYSGNKYLQLLIKKLKYYFAFDASKTIGRMMRYYLDHIYFKIDNYVIVPVPLHWKRLFFRGFNQSELLAKQIGMTKKLLKRVRYTLQQAKLSKDCRLKNIERAFKFKVNNQIPLRVLLIDDVASTCTTIDECARVLKEAGVKEVWGFVLARNVI